jgi:hypothetical protein
MKQEMQFPVTNKCIKWFNNTLCSWGQRKTNYDVEGNIKGMTAPLWANPSKVFYKIFFIVSLICSLLFVGCFIAIQFYNNDLTNKKPDTTTAVDVNYTCVKESYEHLKSPFIVIGSIILFINGKPIS